MDIWTGLLVLSKAGLYWGSAGIIGAFWISLWAPMRDLQSDWTNYLGVSALLGLAATIIVFLLRVGSVAGQGVMGMFDPYLLGAFAASAVGKSALVRGVGFVFLLILWWWLSRAQLTFGSSGLAARMLAYVGTLGVVLGFPLIGHSLELGLLYRLVLAAHILAIGWWIGALYPLWRVCRQKTAEQIYPVMYGFGRMAAYVVGVLLLAGVFLLFGVLDSPPEMVTTTYGRALLLKLVLVLCLLGLAARNKLKWTPELKQGEAPRALRRSIGMEMIAALAILLTTAFLTSAVGPVSLH